MHASPLQAIRIAVANLAAARHFWESAMGFHCVGETEVDDPILRRLWGTEGGSMWAARLERPGSSRIELFHWEGCTGQPIRDPHRPWDLGVAELQWQSDQPERLLASLQRTCEIIAGGSAFVTPFGERCRIVPGINEAVVLSVAALDEGHAFFAETLGWKARPVQQDASFAGAASVSRWESVRFCSNGSGAGNVEASRFERVADPRTAIATAPRMSPAYTGVWMLTACVDRLPPLDAIVNVEVPFVGMRRALVTRAPGGVRFGVFERD